MPRASAWRSSRRLRAASAVDDARTDAELRHVLRQSTVAIIGCGGLGSNIAAMLVRSGVGALLLADPDHVDATNLNRQFFFRDQVGARKVEALAANLRRIDPGTRVTTLHARVVRMTLPTFVLGADVIVEAVDSAADKAMIINSCLAELPGVPVVGASGLAGIGSANDIVTERIAENLYMVGDLTSDAAAGLPLFASRVMAAAAAQAHMVTRLLLGYREP